METITETESVQQVPRRASMDCFNNNLLDTVGKALHLVSRTASLPCPEYYATRTAEAKLPPAPRKQEKVRKLPVKDFQLRQSPLTELLEVPHFRTLHHIAMASMMLILLNTLIMDFSDDGVIDLGMQRMLSLLGEVPRTWALIQWGSTAANASVWTQMHFSNCVLK